MASSRWTEKELADYQLRGSPTRDAKPATDKVDRIDPTEVPFPAETSEYQPVMPTLPRIAKLNLPVPQRGHCRRCELEGGGFCRCGCIPCKQTRQRVRKEASAVDVTRDYRKRDYKADLIFQLDGAGISTEPEFRIFEDRKFRADWRISDTRILVEYEGGIFHKGKMGHSSITGIMRDVEKGNLCAIGGWIVIRVTPKHVTSGEALRWIEAAVEAESAVAAGGAS